MTKELKTLYDLVIEKWDYVVGLMCAIALSTIITFSASDLLLRDSPNTWIITNVWYIKLVLAAIISLVIFCCWLYGRRYPQSHPGKIAILIAVRDDTELSAKIKRELSYRLNDLVKQTASGDMIEVLTLRNFRAKHIEDKIDAVKVSNKTRAPFIIHGRIVELGGRIEFALSFTVRHIPLSGPNKEEVERSLDRQELGVSRKRLDERSKNHN